jgi:FkbM family methyltransferase
MILFDIGANRGDAVVAGLEKGYKVIAVEAAPRVFKQLVCNFIYNPNVVPLRFAVSDTADQVIEFYEAEEDGLSTMNKDWLTDERLPYAGKPYRTVQARTITIDDLALEYGKPDLIKIDVEGAEWSVFKGMTKKYGTLTFEWTDATLDEHQKQIKYLADLGYTEVAPQFILQHLREPYETHWHDIATFNFAEWLLEAAPYWEEGAWKEARLRPTADVGMCWVR